MELNGNFLPNTKYELNFDGNPNIRDGFHLPFQSSSVSFTTDLTENLLLEPEHKSLYFFESSFEQNWTALARAGSSKSRLQSIKIWNISPDSLEEALSCNYLHPGSAFTSSNYYQLDIPRSLSVDEMEEVSVPGNSIFGDSGLALKQHIYHTNNPYLQSSLISRFFL